jgi:hypothetical protein
VLLGDSRPARLTVDVETNAERAVLVFDYFLHNTRYTRLLSGEGLSDFDFLHFASFSLVWRASHCFC